MISIEKLNEVYIRVYADAGIEQELSEFFQFRVEGYKFTPAYRSGRWDGFIRLYNLQTKTLYLGLLSLVISFAKDRGYDYKFLNEIFVKTNITKEDVQKYIDDLELVSRGKRIEAHDYQIEAVYQSMVRQRVLLLSPTASGKSLIIYCLMRMHLDNNRKCLIIVPSISLVNQMYTDFEDYSTVNGWNAKVNCHMITGGVEKSNKSNVVISTWQSIFKQPASWFKQFDVIFGDEAHTFAAKSLTSVMEKMTTAKYRIATTGTLHDSKTNKLALIGLFGQIYQVITTRELMDSNKVSDLKIKCLLLKHSDEDRHAYCKVAYKDEMKFIVTNPTRNKFIRNLSISTEGNTLVLFQYVSHGKHLYDIIKQKVGDSRKVFLIHGGVSGEDREEARYIVEDESNAIIIASYGTFQQGINIPSIENIIFGSPAKSKVRNLQSIGRGLRLKEGKDKCNLFDISDDLSHKKSMNHTLKHLTERVKIYSQEKFDFKIMEIPLA